MHNFCKAWFELPLGTLLKLGTFVRIWSTSSQLALYVNLSNVISWFSNSSQGVNSYSLMLTELDLLWSIFMQIVSNLNLLFYHCLIRHCWLAGLSLKCKVENGKVQPAICSKQKQVVCILLKFNSTQCVAVLASSQRSFLRSWANSNRSSPTIPLLPSYRRQHRLSRNLRESLHQQSDLVTLASIIIAWYQSFLLVCGKWSATVIFAVHPASRSIQFNHKFWRNTNALFRIQLLSLSFLSFTCDVL